MKGKKKLKFRSGLNKYIYIALAIYHIMIIAPFIIVNFLWRDIVTWYAYVLIVVDVLFLLPLIFNTYYSLEDTYLFIYQWPFTKIKVYYSDIFVIDSNFPEDLKRKKKKKYGFSKKGVVVGYYGEYLDRKEKKIEKEKRYVFISPRDYDAFMIRIGGKFSSAKSIAKKIEETMKINEEKHAKKKEEVALERKKKADANKPVDIVVKGNKSRSNKVKVVDSDDEDKKE